MYSIALKVKSNLPMVDVRNAKRGSTCSPFQMDKHLAKSARTQSLNVSEAPQCSHCQDIGEAQTKQTSSTNASLVRHALEKQGKKMLLITHALKAIKEYCALTAKVDIRRCNLNSDAQNVQTLI
ncbi:hypothetical protein FGO68_gene5029 [Halteria grandinella]|uniref:Uncharacterized protein n=1 Tax=Halteria grandinella TaxID=5974 RepID=A0A8J8P995_HALGN|nr:hypothetical protein FGO68_gene5029 [Halteria grandinella]